MGDLTEKAKVFDKVIIFLYYMATSFPDAVFLRIRQNKIERAQ